MTAWRQLGDLREPARLRAWLCGIVRNLVNHARRNNRRDPMHAAEMIEAAAGLPASEPPPVEQVITREEEAILWRSLERIPEPDREPLVLFYRERESISQVAAALELSEDAVKQRLSRGRKMLQEQVAAFVEGALRRSVPGKAFTLGVVAALPALTASIENTRSPRERRFMVRFVWITTGLALAFTAAVLGLGLFGRPLLRSLPGVYATLLVGVLTLYPIGIVVLSLRANRRQRQIRYEDTRINSRCSGRMKCFATA